MNIKYIQNWHDGYSFPVEGRTDDEIKEMKEYGYVELDAFKREDRRADGYFCGTCQYYQAKPYSFSQNATRNDGLCIKFQFRDRDYGCCAAWEPIGSEFLE